MYVSKRKSTEYFVSSSFILLPNAGNTLPNSSDKIILICGSSAPSPFLRFIRSNSHAHAHRMRSLHRWMSVRALLWNVNELLWGRMAYAEHVSVIFNKIVQWISNLNATAWCVKMALCLEQQWELHVRWNLISNFKRHRCLGKVNDSRLRAKLWFDVIFLADRTKVICRRWRKCTRMHIDYSSRLI